ncbi:MAG: WD40 repeat domain-containing protein [Anaerolineae bacterium]|nr:WD40 repeat domain-containing protein [Anaerolineae bacterium]
MAFHTLNLTTAPHIAEISGETCGFITRVAWSPSGGALAVGYGGGVMLWKGGFGGKPDAHFKHAAPIRDIAFSPDGKWLAAASGDTNVYILDTLGLNIITSFQAADSADCVTVSPDGQLLIAGYASGLLRRFDLKARKHADAAAHQAEISRLVFSMPTRLLSGSRDGTLKLWEVDSFNVIDSLQRVAEMDRALWASVNKLQENDAGSPPLRPVWVKDIAIDQDQAAVAWKDGTIVLYSLAEHTLSQTHSLEGHKGGVDSLTFSSDGRLLASGGRDHQIKLWDVSSRSLLTTLASHRKPVLTLAFAVNDLFLISGGGDNALKLWGVER